MLLCLAHTTTTYRRSMGLPPAQGYNNLRLNTTTNYYPKYRLDNTTQYTKIHKPKQSFYTNSLHHPSSILPSCLTFHLQNTKNDHRIKPSSRYSQFLTQNISTGRHISRRSSYDSHLLPIRFNHRKFNENVSNSFISRERKKRSFSNEQQRYRRNENFRNANISNSISSNANTSIVSNIPSINVNSSTGLVNSPFGLRDPCVGIFHHCSQSISYF